MLQTAQPYRADPVPRDAETLASLRLRFFSPAEIARLHGFPDTHRWPDKTTLRQRYKMLGNGLSVTVVSHLLAYLVKEGAVVGGEEEEDGGGGGGGGE